MAISLMLLLFTMVCLGRLELAEACTRRLTEIATSVDDESEFVRHAREAVQPFAHGAQGFYEWSMGMYDHAERVLRSAIVFSDRLGPTVSYAYSYLGQVLVDHCRIADAQEVALQMIAQAKVTGQLASEGRGRWVLSDALRVAGNFARAEVEGRRAVDLLKNVPIDLPAAQASLANAIRMQGRHVEALAMAEQSIQCQVAAGQFAYRRVFVQLAYAECLHAVGQLPEASARIKATIEWIETVASTIESAAQRRIFLEEVVENRRAFELARAWAPAPSAPETTPTATPPKPPQGRDCEHVG